MEILLIHQYFLTPNGSGGSRFNEMTRLWAEKDHNTTVLSGMIYHNSGKKYPQFKGKLFEEEIHSDKVRVIRCHDSDGGQKNFISRLKVYFVFVLTSLWAGLFKTNRKFDIIIVSSPPLFVGITALIISIFSKVPFIFEIRDLWPESAIDTGVLKNRLLVNLSFKLEKLIYNQALAINVLTPAFKNVLVKSKGIPSNKIFCVSNGADFSISDNLLLTFKPDQFRIKLGIELETLLITYVGAHGVANGLDQVLNTAKILRNENVLFLLIGDGMMKSALIEKKEKENINNVRFIDPVSKIDALKHILSSDIGLSILIKNDTFKTVFSNKTFDYMSCKKATLMVIDGISKELIENSNSGTFVEPENSIDFAEKVSHYIINRKLIV